MSGVSLRHEKRAAIARRAASHGKQVGARGKAPPLRARRGLLLQLNLVWRRCALGSNAIICHGVWGFGARRVAQRVNRTGETRWHRPRRLAAFLLRGAAA